MKRFPFFSITRCKLDVELFDVDLDSLSGNNRNMMTVIEEDNTNNDNMVSVSRIKLRYLDHPDLMCLARDTILRALGELLGPKYGAIFVDEVISDFMEASFQIPKTDIINNGNGINHSDDLYIGWLHDWLGSLIVAREVLLGSFSTATTTTATERQRHHESSSSAKKKEKRRNRILQSLASSTLPLLVDSSLWNLPSDNQLTTIKNNNNNIALSPQILHRNNIVVVLLMELIGSFCKVLRRGAEDVLTSILYPVVDKTTCSGSTPSSAVVRSTGLSTLKIMSLSCGLQSTENLIYTEQNQLVAAMVGRLRLPGGSRIPRSRNDAEEIMHVTRTSIWAIKMISRRINNNSNTNERINEKENSDATTKGGGKSSMVDLVSLLDYRLDHLFLQKVLVDADVEIVCSLHKAFFNYFLYLFGVNREVTYSYQMKNLERDSKQPWLDMLSQFRKIAVNSSETENRDDATGDWGRFLDVTKADIALFSKLIARDCYLLSYKNLESRISSCDSLTIAFKFLAFVGSEHEVSAILRRILICSTFGNHFDLAKYSLLILFWLYFFLYCY